MPFYNYTSFWSLLAYLQWLGAQNLLVQPSPSWDSALRKVPIILSWHLSSHSFRSLLVALKRPFGLYQHFKAFPNHLCAGLGHPIRFEFGHIHFFFNFKPWRNPSLYKSSLCSHISSPRFLLPFFSLGIILTTTCTIAKKLRARASVPSCPNLNPTISLTNWPWAHYLTSLHLGFLIYKIETIIILGS